MPQLEFSELAESDLDEIWRYIARNSPRNADLLVERIHRRCRETLAQNPLIGRRRDELAPGLHSFVFRPYVIFYRPIDHGVEIVRVVHGRRDIAALFS